MMTESEFKLHMSVYIQKLTTPMQHRLKQMEQKINRLEAIINGDISPAFPYKKETDPTVSPIRIVVDNTENASSDNEDKKDFIIEDYLKLIHEDVSIIKDFIDEYRLSSSDRHIMDLQ